jgi:hypothetical protein
MNLYEIIILILVIALSIIAIRISFKFDLNKYLENRRKIKLDQLKNICPHGRIIDINGNQIKFESLFSSPMGTPKWICSQCGCVVDHEEDVNRINEKYGKNPSMILEKQKEFIKKAKKLNII